MALIKHQQLVDEDLWQRVETPQALPEDADIIVDWSLFSVSPKDWLDRSGRLGLLVTGEVEPEELAPYLGQVALIAVNFTKFTDGRGYSQARILRSRYAFSGELRAVGDIMRDQLLFLARCGFDAFELKAGKDAQGALDAFAELPVRYQSAGDNATPPWKRYLGGR